MSICGCKWGSEKGFQYCTLHESAEDLLATLKRFVAAINFIQDTTNAVRVGQVLIEAERLIAKVASVGESPAPATTKRDQYFGTPCGHCGKSIPIGELESHLANAHPVERVAAPPEPVTAHKQLEQMVNDFCNSSYASNVLPDELFLILKEAYDLGQAKVSTIPRTRAWE